MKPCVTRLLWSIRKLGLSLTLQDLRNFSGNLWTLSHEDHALTTFNEEPAVRSSSPRTVWIWPRASDCPKPMRRFLLGLNSKIRTLNNEATIPPLPPDPSCPQTFHALKSLPLTRQSSPVIPTPQAMIFLAWKLLNFNSARPQGSEKAIHCPEPMLKASGGVRLYNDSANGLNDTYIYIYIGISVSSMYIRMITISLSTPYALSN